MKQAVIIGAGSIGRGFLGQILTEGGYAVTFLDVNSELVEQLNRRGSYPLEIVSTNRIERRFIGPVCAVNGNDREASARAIADCDLCVTCVGAKAIPYIIPNLAAGVKLRFADGGTALNLLICENLMDADVYIRSLLETHLTVEELDTVGLVETSVGRMVPLPDKNAADPLLVRAEAYPVLPYDRDACIGELPKAQGLIPVPLCDRAKALYPQHGARRLRLPRHETWIRDHRGRHRRSGDSVDGAGGDDGICFCTFQTLRQTT